MFAYAVQFGVGDHPTRGSIAPAFLMIAVAALCGALMLGLLTPVAARLRRVLRSRRLRQRRLEAAAGAELRLRMQMDELCPHGWQAQLTVFSSPDHLPDEAPQPERTRVAIDWAVFEADTPAENLVIRRVWAATITEALQAMVTDRATDETLAEIEQLARADGAEWPED
ncbi:MAG TPA: hypothetical protein VFN48_00245 [Solirubrobacteraceae bacterium]|nr:hypothetical protein [Solirubrobacteraceae bacterium]